MEKMDLSIGEIIEACKGKLCETNAADSMLEQQVTSVVLDSRKVTEGGVFVATVGERVDGHKFISDVFEKGVSLVIGQKLPTEICKEHGLDSANWKNYIVVEDCFTALKQIAEFYRSKLNIQIVGITGSVGKTSTKEFIAGVLGEKYNVLKTEGNFNNEVGVPLTLLRIRPNHQVAVVEMGISDFGEMHRLSKMVRPTVCVMTNIGQCHLENLGDRDGVLRAKSEIFDFMAEDGKICLNFEDDKLSTLTEVKGKIPYRFGFNGGDSYATNMESHGLFGTDAVLHLKDKSFAVKVPLPGAHMVLNAAAGALVGSLLGLTTEEIAAGIAKITPVSGRNNLIPLEKYTLIDDCYNANPVSMKAALDLLQMADTYKIAILGDMFELGENSDELHAQVGTAAALSGADSIICVGENSRHMYEAAKQKAADNQKVTYFATRQKLQDAIKAENAEKAIGDEKANANLITEGATILLKASHGMQFTELLELLKEQAAK